ncbi:MAG: hypothetical protein AAGN35_27965 [Bacteroidota bacterium]
MRSYFEIDGFVLYLQTQAGKATVRFAGQYGSSLSGAIQHVTMADAREESDRNWRELQAGNPILNQGFSCRPIEKAQIETEPGYLDMQNAWEQSTGRTLQETVWGIGYVHDGRLAYIPNSSLLKVLRLAREVFTGEMESIEKLLKENEVAPTGSSQSVVARLSDFDYLPIAQLANQYKALQQPGQPQFEAVRTELMDAIDEHERYLRPWSAEDLYSLEYHGYYDLLEVARSINQLHAYVRSEVRHKIVPGASPNSNIDYAPFGYDLLAFTELTAAPNLFLILAEIESQLTDRKLPLASGTQIFPAQGTHWHVSYIYNSEDQRTEITRITPAD